MIRYHRLIINLDKSPSYNFLRSERRGAGWLVRAGVEGRREEGEGAGESHQAQQANTSSAQQDNNQSSGKSHRPVVPASVQRGGHRSDRGLHPGEVKQAGGSCH